MRDPGSAALFESLSGASRRLLSPTCSRRGLARLHHDPALLQDRLGQEKEDPCPRCPGVRAGGFRTEQVTTNDLANESDSSREPQVHVYLVELGKYEGKLPKLYRYLKKYQREKIRAKMVNVIGDVGDPLRGIRSNR